MSLRWTSLFLLGALVSGCASQKGAVPAGAETPDGPGKTARSTPKDVARAEFDVETKALQKIVASNKVDWDDMEDRWSSFVGKHPQFAPGIYNLAVTKDRLGKQEEAEALYRQALELDPGLREARENLALLIAARGDSTRAFHMLEELAERDPGAARARVSLAEARLVEGDLTRAAELARESLVYDPQNVRAYCVLARVAQNAKDGQLVRLLVAQGLKLEGQNGGCLHQELGYVFLAEGKVPEAVSEFETAVKLDPTLVLARFEIARISMGYKDFQKAAQSYLEVTKVNPNAVSAWVNLGVAYKASAKFSEAETAYKKAIQVQDSAPDAHFNLGVLYLRNMNRLNDAEAEFKRYLQVGNADSNDDAFAMLEEIEKARAFESEQKRLEEEMRQQEEIDKKVQAEEEAKQKAAGAPPAAEGSPEAAEAPPTPDAAATPAPTPEVTETPEVTPPPPAPKKAPPKKARDEPADPGEPQDP